MATRKRSRASAAKRQSHEAKAAAKETPKRHIGRIAVAVVVLAVGGYFLIPRGAASALPPAIELSHGAARDFNVVLFTLDTLRSDRVGCYGYGGVETPVIDGLAAAGVRFADAVSVVPMTLPSHASIMTGDYPPTHGARDNGTYRVVAQRETLAERFKAAGYSTAAFIAAFVLDHRFGLDQGFDVYDDQITAQHRAAGAEPLNPQRAGDVVTDAAMRWLESHHAQQPERRFFAWVHLFDPHLPYNPPEPFRSRYAADPYDGEVAFTDVQVGRFVDRLRELGQLERTLIVLVGDHGEGLGDHGESGHSLLIYGATMKVPLVFYCPALIPEGRVVADRVVATIDMAPTIADLLGLPALECDGLSLLQPDVDPDRAIYLETTAPELNHGWSPLYGLRRHRDKVIEAPTPEYYDLHADPGELQNLWSDRLDEAEPLAERLDALLSAFAQGGGEGESGLALDADARRKLEALGYIGSGAAPELGPLPDPKDMIARFDEDQRRANALVAAEQPQAAIPLIKGLLAVTPRDASLWSLLSLAQTQTRQIDDAIESRLRAIEIQPNDANAWVALANLQYGRGDAEACRVSLAEAERLDPDLGEIYLTRARHAVRDKQYDRAITECEAAARRDPTRYAARSWLLQGKIYEEMGRPTDALAACERAHEADPANLGIVLTLAQFAERQGRYERVIQLGRSIPPGTPEWPQCRTLMANAHVQLGQGEQAIALMREWVSVAPDKPWTHNNLGGVYHQLGRLSEAAACYQMALQLDPSYVRARKNLAAVRQAQADAQRPGGATP